MEIKTSLKKNEIGKIGDNVIIKSTGSISKIKNIYGMMKVEVTLPMEILSSLSKEKLSKLYTFNDEEKEKKNKSGWIYELINDIEYHEDDLIIGDINIREHKINQINGV